jgi:enoyl-CoA hydratase
MEVAGEEAHIIRSMPDQFVLVDSSDKVAVVRLNRPEKLNALSPEMLRSVADALQRLEEDGGVRVIVLTGGEKVFAAGADIEAMAMASPVDMLLRSTLRSWRRIAAIDKPLIAAVNGVAFGGGCELAMLCDLIVAGGSSRFGQPEIKLGIMPGAGGTQRLARAVGSARAMEMILTGEPISAQEALAAGLVNRVVADDKVLDQSKALANMIAARPPVAVRMARKAVRFGYERTMAEGFEIERRNYRLLYDTEDQKEGMAAFLEKREPKFKGK